MEQQKPKRTRKSVPKKPHVRKGHMRVNKDGVKFFVRAIAINKDK